MRVLFFIWGGFGLFLTFSILFNPSAGQTSGFVSSLMLMWIGGMVFFGLGSLLLNRETEKAAKPIGMDGYENAGRQVRHFLRG